MYRYRRYGIVKTESFGTELTEKEIRQYRAEAETSAPKNKRLSDLPTQEIINRGIERSKSANRNMYENIGREL